MLNVASDPERGVRYYVRACGLGNESSCLRAGALYVEGSKKPDGTDIFKKSPPEGLTLLDTACRQGASRSCEQLGIDLTADKYKVKDSKRAAALFDDLCKKNNKAACAEYALLQVNGDGVKADPTAARKTLEDLCYDQKVTTACYGVGLLADLGIGGVVENKPKAVEYYSKSTGVKDASLRLARLYESGGKGVTADPAKAATYYGSACYRPAETDPSVCRKAGELAEKQKKFAMSYYSRACSMAPWDKVSCEKVKELSKAPPPSIFPPGSKPPTSSSAGAPPGKAPPPPPPPPPAPKPKK
jgi:TPR repeat protein